MSQRVVIVGAGQAGVQLAISLRQGGFQGEVQLLGAEPHVPYQRPPLSKQILKREWAAERCQLRHLEFYEQHEIDLLLGRRAHALRADDRALELDDGETLAFDKLAVCTGATLNRLDVPGADLPGVYYLRTVDEALALSGQLLADARLVVVGGGYIGLEVAAAARSLGCVVTVVEFQDEVMKRSALPEVARHLREYHQQQGVRFLLGRAVRSLVGGDHVTAVQLDDGSELEADAVMIGVGVQPDVSWLKDSGIRLGRGILVDQQCQSSIAGIYAAGDVAECSHPLLNGWQVLESVQNAIGQARVVAASMLDQEASYNEAPWFWSEQYDQRLQMAGLPRSGDELVRREHPQTGGFSIFSIDSGEVHAVQSINAPRDYMVGRQLIGHHTRVTQQQVSNPDFDLKELL